MPSQYKPNFNVRSLTASAALTDFDAGTTIALNAAAGLTVTLPAAEGSGATFDIVVGTTVTSNNYVIEVASSDDGILGAVGVATDAAGVTIPTTTTSDTVTMNGSTTGGIRGSNMTLTDIASGVWAIRGNLVSSGTEATPFSAAV